MQRGVDRIRFMGLLSCVLCGVLTLPLRANESRSVEQAAEEMGYDESSALLNLSSQRIESADGIERYTRAVRFSLRDNLLTEIGADALQGKEHLRSLYLDSNQLTTLPADLFHSTPNLQKLWINNNQITSFPAGTFQSLHQLRLLDIKHNQLQGELDLSEMSLQHLQRFYVRTGNSITAVNFSGSSFSQRSIEEIVEDLAGGGVASLDLSGVDLSFLTAREFASFPLWTDLETLVLTDANFVIEALDLWIVHFPQLRSLTLSEEQYMPIAMLEDMVLSRWARNPQHQLIIIPQGE